MSTPLQVREIEGDWNTWAGHFVFDQAYLGREVPSEERLEEEIFGAARATGRFETKERILATGAKNCSANDRPKYGPIALCLAS
jgi:hypothetical protein